jgi:hypothetical protein
VDQVMSNTTIVAGVERRRKGGRDVRKVKYYRAYLVMLLRVKMMPCQK